MNPPKCDDTDYIHCLIASQRVFTCTQAARCQPDTQGTAAHDAFTRLLAPIRRRCGSKHSSGYTSRRGYDDTILDQPYAQQMEWVCDHWSGKYRRVVQGICLLRLLCTQGEALVPCDYRVYTKRETKNEFFRAMLGVAHARGFTPKYVQMDSGILG
ncbi:MAG: hypothetical protein KatS3mg023_1842 [Armatimonadota bacterium]|nr:MAG: hypothetical protein KatS3mg023_1842 [Armatimonadota bacterium]